MNNEVIAEEANECQQYRSVNATNGCFVAGTLVHTKEGLKPIEQIRVGDMVLSQPDMKGELAYKPVVNTFEFEDKVVGLLEFFADSKECLLGRLVVTPNHPFWVKDVGWTSAENLEAGQRFILYDGSTAAVWQYRELRNTEVQNKAWACEFHPEVGNIVDFRSDSFVVIDEESWNAYALALEGGWLKRKVYNLEVEDFHTYYVGELGVWVHNTNCDGKIG